MFKVAVCDDNPVQLTILEDLITAFAKDTGREIDTMCYDTGERLLADMNRGYSAHIYILDMILPGIRGIELGKEIRNRGDKGRIIYLTATAEYAVDSYQVGAFYYILKPISMQKITEVLEKAITDVVTEKLKNLSVPGEDKRVEIKTKMGPKSILLSDILYVDITNRALTYHMEDGNVYSTVMLREPFADAVSGLTIFPYMLHASASLLINLQNIKQADKTSVTFFSGERIFPTRNACNAVLNYMRGDDRDALPFAKPLNQ